MNSQELKTLIKDSLKEVLREERLLLCKILVPYVDAQEQEELETILGLPKDYETEEATDMTDWIKDGD